MAVNIENNAEFKKLFNSVKERYEKGAELWSKELHVDTSEVIANMITAIELGKGDDAFVGVFLPKMNREYNYKLSAPAAITIKNNTPTILINPQILFTMCNDYTDFKSIIQHEVYHLVFKHLIPSRNYPNHDRTNIAMDVSINQYINFSDNLKSVLYTLDTFKYKFNLSNVEERREFEYYYELIPDDFNNTDDTLKNMLKELNGLMDKKNGGDSSEELEEEINDLKEKIKDYIKNNYVLGDINPTDDKNSNNGLTLSEQMTLNELIDGCLNEAKSRGKIPGSIEGTLNDLYYKNPIIPWTKELRHSIGSVPCPYKKTMRVKNRRQPNRADLLGRVNDRKITLYVAFDTSGSVSDEVCKFFWNELFNITKDVNCNIVLIQCDASINNVTKIKNKNDVSKIKLCGRGGTCFEPVFEYIHDKVPKPERPDVLIYFTDGYGESNIRSELRGNFDLIWVLSGLNDTLSVKNPEFIKKVRYLNIEGKKYL